MAIIQDSKVAEKFEAVRVEAARRFSARRQGSGTPPPVPIGTTVDPRLLDYMYENTFAPGDLPPAAARGPRQGPANLDSVRAAIFALPDFAPAADRVAYSEDLLTRAVSLLEGMARCRLCGSNNTTVTVRQMHSSDEAPTMLLYCGSCHHRTTQTGE